MAANEIDVGDEYGPIMEKVKRVPVKLYENEVGDKYFFLKRFSFPQNKITKLVIQYGPDQARDLSHQDLGDKVVMLHDCPIECHLEGSSESDSSSMKKSDEFLTDTSFALPGVKIRAIRIRMYTKQKTQAQKQLSDGKGMINLRCEIECRLAANEPALVAEESSPATDEEAPAEDPALQDEVPKEESPAASE